MLNISEVHFPVMTVLLFKIRYLLFVMQYAEGMTSFLKSKNIRIFDYREFAKGLRDTIIANAEHLAKTII